MDAPSPALPEKKRIAVIAVHGVADQKPNESNAAIASLLVQHGERPGTAHGRYMPFVSHEVHLPQFPVIPPPDEAVEILLQSGGVAGRGDHRSRRHSRWQMRSNRDYIRNTEEALEAPDDARTLYVRAENAGPEPEDPRDAAGELGYQFMRMQLRDHQPDGSASTYVTTVLRSVRRGGAGTPVDTEAPAAGERPADEREVDVFEVYWADLSRPAQGALNFFSTAYQLLLHVATLGRQAVDDTALDYKSWPWRVIRGIQQFAVFLLTLPIPLLNLIMLIVGFGVIPAGFIAGYAKGPVIAVCTVLGVTGALVSYRWMRENVPDRPLVWSLLPFAGAAVGVGLGVGLGRLVDGADLLSGTQHKGMGASISLAWWVVGAGITYWVASKYQRLRVGALPVAMLSYAAALVVFTYWMIDLREKEVVGRLELSTLLTMQLIFASLRVCWLLLVGCAVLLTLFWFVVRWDAKRDPRRDPKARLSDDPRWSRCRAALRTGRLAIGLSSGTFLLFTLLAWAGIFAFTVSRFDVFARTKVATASEHYRALTPVLLPDTGRMGEMDHILAQRELDELKKVKPEGPREKEAHEHAVDDAERDRDEFTVPEYFQGMIATSITPTAPIAVIPMAAALLLLLWMALPSVKAEGNAKAECTNPQSLQMGRWLSRGLDSTRLVTHLIYAALLTPLVFTGLLAVAKRNRWESVLELNHDLELFTYGAAGLAGTLIAASAVVIFSFLAKFGGSALDVVLDVDNYLRTTPPEATPRARICQRYVSLLRYVAGAKGESRYDGVVIVAHSLGALISADLLRFLQRERALGGDPALAPLGFDGGSGRGEIPITLITMGNPVRQLLSRFFPHRYQWVRDNPDNGAAPLPALDSDLPEASQWSSTPDARWLGVRRWVNVYRSGDYVGRSLWLMEWYHRTLGGPAGGGYDRRFFTSTTLHGDVEVSEGCIGAGAHTHYWDMTAPDVSDRIDALIATA